MKNYVLTQPMQETYNQLLTVNKNILRVLHRIARFDFQKQFAVYRIDGRFTPNRVLKLTQENCSEPQAIALLTYNPDTCLQNWRLIGLDKFGNFQLCHGTIYDLCGNVNNCSKKSDIETWRKKDDTTTFVIAQKRSLLTPEKQKSSPDLSVRFEIPSKTKIFHWGRHIYEMILQEHDTNAESVKYRLPDSLISRIGDEQIHDVIDKSGYLVLERRQDLNRKARELRAKRYEEKCRKLCLQYAERLQGIKEELAQIKSELASQLEAAATVQKCKKIAIILYCPFNDAITTVKHLEQEEPRASFAQLEWKYNYLFSIMKTLSVDMEKLRALDEFKSAQETGKKADATADQNLCNACAHNISSDGHYCEYDCVGVIKIEGDSVVASCEDYEKKGEVCRDKT